MPADALATVSVPGWEVEYVEATPSTNALARDHARPGLVAVTDHQTAGRGRLDRTWETPAGVALTCSAVVDPRRPDQDWPWLPLLVGVVVADAVRSTAGVDAALKWPNDVLVGDRKLAGILVERVPGPLAVVGVGVNVHQTELPVPTATSLALEAAAVDRDILLTALLTGYDEALADWARPGGADRLRRAYADRCSTVGRDVSVELADGVLTGRAIGVDEHGRLEVSDPVGGVRALSAGDVVHVRPTNG